MANELFVLNEGVNVPTNFTLTLTADTYNINTSVNPNIVTKSSSSGTTYLNCYEIHKTKQVGGGPHMAADMTNTGTLLNRMFPKSTTVVDYGLNLLETPGHRITVDLGTEGYTSGSPLSIDLTVRDHFVLIYADDPKKHHFAKITDQSVYEGNKQNFDFTPALKENVPYGTNVAIFSGPVVGDADVVAVAYGLLKNSSDDRHGNYVQVSKPTFYFYENLEPDTKYTAIKQTDQVAEVYSVFKTAPTSSNFIIDKSFYTQNGEIVDNNKAGDEVAGSSKTNYTQYDGTTGTYTFDVTDWDASSKNYDWKWTNQSTYIRPITSPLKNQYMGHIMGVNLNRSITNKGNMAEVKFIDPERMLERKINDYENFNIKEVIGKESIGYRPEAVLPGTYNGSSSTITVTGLEKGVDLKDLLGSSAPFELIYIGDYYYKLSAISAVSGGEQTLTVSDRRLFSAFKFEGSSTVDTMTNATAYRNRWSTKVNNLIVSHEIDTVIDSGTLKRSGITLNNSESDINNLEYNIVGANGGIILTAKRGDKLAKYVEINETMSSNYINGGNILNAVKGEIVVNKKVFKGKAEYIETNTEGGLFSLTVSGRDEIATLLDYPINKNFLYSKEWVTSTISPVTDSFTDTGLDITTTSGTEQLGNNSVIVSGTTTVPLTYGDVLYVLYNSKYTPLGVVSQDVSSSSSPSTVSLLNDLLIEPHTDYNGTDALDNSNIYVGKNKLLAGKSLHNHYRTTPHSSLYGAADKGMVFYGTANTINKTGSSASDGVSILSLNNPDNDSKNYGMDINGVVALEGSSDSPKDSPYGLDFDYRLVGSLSHLHLIGSPISVEDNVINVELGNISPIVMARMDRNDDVRNGTYTLDSFYTNSIGLYFLNKQGIDRGGFIHLLDNNNDSENKGSTWRRLVTEDRSDTCTTNNYAFRFGSPIFRYTNLSDTSLKYWRLIQDNNNSVLGRKDKPNPFYFDKPSQFIAYASALRVMGNEAVGKDYHRDQSSSHLKELPIEQSWQYPVSGSTHIDMLIKDNNIHQSVHDYGYFIKPASVSSADTIPVFESKNFMEMDDPMCNSYFLFAPGDMLPDSQKRPDHIFFNGSDSVTRNTSDYFLLIKYIDTISNTSINHDMYKGKTKFTIPSDDNYELLPISSNLDSIPKRFNLMRLKSMTLDTYMNEVDYETYPIGNSFDTRELSTNASLGRSTNRLAKSIPDIGYSVYEVSTTSATSSSSTNIQVTTTVPFFDVGSPNTQSRLAFDNNNYYGISGLATQPSTNPSLEVYTNPDDGDGEVRHLGTIDVANSDIDTIVLTSNCKVNAYTSKIFTIENDGILGAEGRATSTTNKGVHNFPGSDDSKHNHNIHRTTGLQSIVKENYIFYNLRYVRPIRNNKPHRHKGNIKFVDAQTSSSPYTVKIEFEPLTYNSGASNVVVDLSNYEVGDTLTTSGSGTPAMNTNWIITAINGTSASPRQITVRHSTNATYAVVNTGSYESTVLLENTTSGTLNICCNPSNFINSISRDSTISTTQDIGAFTGLQPVLVSAAGTRFADQDSELGVARRKDRKIYFREDNFTNNYVELNTASESAVVIAASATLGGVASNITKDVIRLATQNEWIFGSSASDRAGDDVELLFVPTISENYGNVTKVDGVRASKYTDEAYLRIETALNPSVSTWNTDNYINWINYCPNLTGKFLVRPSTNEFFRILSHTISKNESNGSDIGKVIHYLHIDGNKPNFTDATCDLTNGSNTVTCDANTNIKLHQEVTYGSSGLADKTRIIQITESGGAGTGVTSFVLSNNFTGSTNSNQTLTFNTLSTENLVVSNLCTATMQEDKLNYILYDFNTGNVINPKTNKFFKKNHIEYGWGDWEVGSGSHNNKVYTSTGEPHKGGVRGMFVVAELDGSGSPTLIHKDASTLFASSESNTKFAHNIETNVYLTDGINSIKSTMIPRLDNVGGISATIYDEEKVILEFSETANLKGSVSIGETFNLTVQGKIKGDVEYVKIVTPFNVSPEVEQAVDQIFGENNISYTVSNNTNKYYAGNNFTGQDSYTASNILLANKNLKLDVNGDIIKVVSNEEDKDFRAIEISEENSIIKVVQIKKDKSLLDNFNEVIVYGDGHKGVARNYSDIKKRGKTKTKEIFDYSIITQKEVDQKAVNSLKLFSNIEKAVELTIAQDLPLLEPGNIITLYYPSEGISRQPYTVLEIEKSLGMPTKLLLGQYNKDLSNTLSGLLSVTKDLQGNTKRKTYASVYVPNVSVQTTKFKFIQAKVTTNTGTPAIGFTYTIGFDAGIEP